MLNLDLSNLSAEEAFFGFFAVSFALLFLIMMAALPGIIRSGWREIRLLAVRSRRAGRTIAEKKSLLALSSKIEGIYYFEDPLDLLDACDEEPAERSAKEDAFDITEQARSEASPERAEGISAAVARRASERAAAREMNIDAA